MKLAYQCTRCGAVGRIVVTVSGSMTFAAVPSGRGGFVRQDAPLSIHIDGYSDTEPECEACDTGAAQLHEIAEELDLDAVIPTDDTKTGTWIALEFAADWTREGTTVFAGPEAAELAAGLKAAVQTRDELDEILLTVFACPDSIDPDKRWPDAYWADDVEDALSHLWQNDGIEID